MNPPPWTDFGPSSLYGGLSITFPCLSLFLHKSDRKYEGMVLEYKKRLLLRCKRHFKSDSINNMDHMRISGIEPSSVILSQRKYLQKLKNNAKKCQNKLKPKGMM